MVRLHCDLGEWGSLDIKCSIWLRGEQKLIWMCPASDTKSEPFLLSWEEKCGRISAGSPRRKYCKEKVKFGCVSSAEFTQRESIGRMGRRTPGLSGKVTALVR